MKMVSLRVTDAELYALRLLVARRVGRSVSGLLRAGLPQLFKENGIDPEKLWNDHKAEVYRSQHRK